VNSDSSLYLDEPYTESPVSDGLSIALIGPDEERRKAAASALAGCQGGVIREFSTYPPSMDDVPKLLEQHHDVIIIDLDSRPEYALELVESICANGAATVMVYSVKFDSDLLVRCMRAGAREFLTLPFTQSTVAEALVRASARRPAPRPTKKAGGKLMAFLGAKGGDGVTTLACNFAVSMAQESGQSTLLIDLDLPLGDAALNLGVVAEYSTINALQNAARLDSAFLSKLLVKHSSGVSVLAAPGKFPQFDASHEAIDKLLTVARQDFDNVVIDMGSRLDLMGTSLFKEGSTVYLVIQTGIAGLRNSNRLISQYFATDVPKLEIVLNRYQSRSQGVAEDQITKALTRPAQWKIPNDYAAVRRMQHTAVPLALEDSPISRLIRQMSRAACGLPAVPEKGTGEKSSGFSLKNLGRSISAKISSSEPEEAPAIVQPEPAPTQPIQEEAGAAQPEAKAEIPVKSGPASGAEKQPAAVEPVRPAETTDQTDLADAEPVEAPGDSTPSQQSEPETRTYRGATYEKGADGKWHLQKTAASAPPASAEPVSVEQASAEPVRVEEPTAEQNAAVEPVHQETPAIAWSTPAPISYGAALSATQLNAVVTIPGAFVYTPAEGEVLAVGIHTLSVAFTPEDTATCTTAQAAVSLTVNKATPVITWTTPAPIAYGAALSATQLNATASVPGTFFYTPAAGVVPRAGVQTLLVTFTPADTEEYETEQATVSLTITKATPVITWTTPAPIAYGAELSATQLNATASVPGTFVYTPAAGVVPTAGVQTLLVTFTPTDTEDYATEQATVSLTITKATPAVAWPTPEPIAYGVALSAAQLNATALVPGKFTYLPGIGAVLAAGRHSLTLTFVPTDSTNYTAAHATVSLAVSKATPAITWATPASIAYGAALSAAQLNATASVPGQFVYTPAAGEVLTAGVQALSVVFTPTDAENYTAADATASLTVTKATPIVTWAKPQAISYGTALSATQLNATASVPGTFVYIPAAGAVLAAGVQPLSATFTPADAANYSEAQGAVWLTISKATPIVIWSAPTPILSGDALSDAQLNATALIPGTFVYTPAAGASLPAGMHRLSVTFTPTAVANYTVVRATVLLTVTEAAPAIPPQAPAQVETPVPQATPAPEMPLVETPVKPPAEPAKPIVEPVQQAPAEVPAAPPAIAAAEPPTEAAAKLPAETPAKALVKVPPPRFAIEAGSGLDLMGTAVFPDGTMIYLVMQPGSGGPQDSKLLVSQFLAGGDLKPEIVINRYEPHPLGAGEDQESPALTRPASSPITQLIGQIAQPVSEPPAPPEKKKGFSLKGLRRSLWAKVSSNDSEQGFTQLGLAPDREDADSTLTVVTADQSIDAPAAEVLPKDETPAPPAPQPATEPADVKRAATPASAPSKQVEPETRTYQGATYVKGADGKWHLRQLPTSFVKTEKPAAVPLTPLPIAVVAAPITTELSPSSQPEPVKAVPVPAMTPATEAEPAPAQTPPETPAKAAEPPVTAVAMAPVMPQVEATPKISVKAAVKPPVKAAIKPPVKAAIKPAVKAAAEAPVEAALVQAMEPAIEAAPEPEKTPAEAPAEAAPAQVMKPAFEAEPDPEKTPAEAPVEAALVQAMEPAIEAAPEPEKTPVETPTEAAPAQALEPAIVAEPEPEKTPVETPTEAAPAQAMEPAVETKPEPEKTQAEAPAKAAAKPPVKAINKPAKNVSAKAPAKSAKKPAKKAPAKASAKSANKSVKKVKAKPPVKAAKKSAKKVSAKALAKPAKKPVKKVKAKSPVKTAKKPAKKNFAKSSVKAARKPAKKVLVKASAKAPAKTAKKAPAKVQARHSAPAKKKLTPSSRAKQAKVAKPKLRKPAPKPVKKR
jgi:Flp pilus assembly CpaE family ATPase